jgi:hypothetical protein
MRGAGREAMSGRAASLLLLAAVALTGCSGKGSVACAPGPDGTPGNCQPWTGQPPATAQRFFYSLRFYCSDGAGGTRTVSITYRSSKDCADARTRYTREPDPCTDFGEEHWPGWKTVKREPVHAGESCD